MKLYTGTKFCEANTISIIIITKGQNSVKMYEALQCLFSGLCLIILYIFPKFRENILNVSELWSGHNLLQTDR